VDQWFSESQFESYRALGERLVRALVGDVKLETLGDLEDRVRDHLGLEPRQRPPAPVTAGDAARAQAVRAQVAG
jgi:hypothetical protein